MPSVMQAMRFQEEFAKMGVGNRDKFINEFLSILETEYRPVVTGAALERFLRFEDKFVSIRGLNEIPDSWYRDLFLNFSGTLYIDRLIFKIKV